MEGRNLAPKDPNGLSDPFLLFGPVDKKGNWAFLEKRNKPLKSGVLRKTLSPMWRMPFELYVFALKVLPLLSLLLALTPLFIHISVDIGLSIRIARLSRWKSGIGI